MIILQGTLRQKAEVSIKSKQDPTQTETRLKLWVEHEMPRDNGVNDLKIEEFFLDPASAKGLPPSGPVNLTVRPYVSGSAIRYQVTGVLPKAA